MRIHWLVFVSFAMYVYFLIFLFSYRFDFSSSSSSVFSLLHFHDSRIHIIQIHRNVIRFLITRRARNFNHQFSKTIFVLREAHILHMSELTKHTNTYRGKKREKEKKSLKSLKYQIKWNEFHVLMCSINVIEMTSYIIYVRIRPRHFFPRPKEFTWFLRERQFQK